MKAITLAALFAGNKIARAAAFAAVAGMCWMPALGGMDDVVLKCETNIEPCSYRVGEKMKFVFSLLALDAAEPIDGLKLKWKRQGDDGKTEEGLVPLSRRPMTVVTSIAKPGFVRMEAWVVDSNGDKVKRTKSIGKSCLGNEEIYFTGGAAAGLKNISQGIAEPSDFNAVWKSAIKRLFADKPVNAGNVASFARELPQSEAGGNPNAVRVAVAVPSYGPNWTDCYATGYLTMPRNAKPGSLKAKVSFDGYGIYRPSIPWTCSDDTIELHINAHGIYPLNLDDSAWEAFQRDVINARGGYAFNDEDNAVFEKAYFFGMAMRVASATTFMREYVKTLPAWNGRDLIVQGGSQGGLQASWAAALVKGVSEVRLEVPWCCDLGGREVGRMGGWRPKWHPTLGYYDPVNMAKRFPKEMTKTVARSALGDYIAPPCGHAVLFNAMKGKKSVEFVQGGDHYADPGHYSQTDARKVCK